MELGGNEIELVDAFKYLGVWFDCKLWGNVKLAKMIETAEKCVGRVECIGQVNG